MIHTYIQINWITINPNKLHYQIQIRESIFTKINYNIISLQKTEQALMKQINPMAESQYQITQPQNPSPRIQPQQVREIPTHVTEEDNQPENPEAQQPRSFPGTLLASLRLRRKRGIAITEKIQKNQAQIQKLPPQTKSILIDQIKPEVMAQTREPEVKPVSSQCSFCAQLFSYHKLQKSFTCGHVYCSPCLKIYFENKIKNHKLIECPQQSCKCAVNQQSDYFKNQAKNLIQNYNLVKFRKKIESDPKLQLCPDEHCKKGYIVVKEGETTGQCKQCKTVFCLKCKMKSHSDKCESFQQILLTDKFKYKQCFGCKSVVERNSGCPHMTCKCGSQFCYYCGDKWSVPHRCLRFLAGGQLITDKINTGLQCIRPQDYQYEYTLLGFLVKIPYYIVCLIIMTIYVAWSLAILVILAALILVGSLFSGYIALQYKLCKDGNTIAKVVFFILLILLPLGIIIGWIAIFCVGISKVFEKYLQLALSGRLFPCFFLFC